MSIFRILLVKNDEEADLAHFGHIVGDVESAKERLAGYDFEVKFSVEERSILEKEDFLKNFHAMVFLFDLDLAEDSETKNKWTGDVLYAYKRWAAAFRTHRPFVVAMIKHWEKVNEDSVEMQTKWNKNSLIHLNSMMSWVQQLEMRSARNQTYFYERHPLQDGKSSDRGTVFVDTEVIVVDPSDELDIFLLRRYCLISFIAATQTTDPAEALDLYDKADRAVGDVTRMLEKTSMFAQAEGPAKRNVTPYVSDPLRFPVNVGLIFNEFLREGMPLRDVRREFDLLLPHHWNVYGNYFKAAYYVFFKDEWYGESAKGWFEEEHDRKLATQLDVLLVVFREYEKGTWKDLRKRIFVPLSYDKPELFVIPIITNKKHETPRRGKLLNDLQDDILANSAGYVSRLIELYKFPPVKDARYLRPELSHRAELQSSDFLMDCVIKESYAGHILRLRGPSHERLFKNFRVTKRVTEAAYEEAQLKKDNWDELPSTRKISSARPFSTKD